MDTPLSVGFCGAGVMGNAIIQGLTSSFGKKLKIYVYDPADPAITTQKASATGSIVCSSNAEVAKNASVILLCVKPMLISKVVSEISKSFTATHQPLIVSIAAGVLCADIEAGLPQGARVVRVMPNTPCSVGASASGYTGGKNATDKDLKIVHELFSSVGMAVHVPMEKDIDAVTGLSGSGVAYVFVFIEALADGGVRAGLTRPVATALAVQTVLGAAQMMKQTNQHPGVLKDQVCSPGGTTIAAIDALESRGFRGTVISAVMSAFNRAKELQKPAPSKL